MSIRLRFWGVRGSVPSPGPETAEFGGNTACVEVSCGEHVLVLDAGTGLRRLGDDLLRRQRGHVHASLLFSHVHWDHIQGLPFFAPLYRPGTSLTLYGAPSGGSLEDALGRQMHSPNFPVSLGAVPASLHFAPVVVGEGFEIGPFRITSSALNHPAGCIAYRVDALGRSVVYATDTEPLGPNRLDEGLVELSRDADLLIHDGMFSDEEYESRKGWGHSSVSRAIEVAERSGAKRLAFFHHNTDATDSVIDAVVEAARERTEVPLDAASEGPAIEL